MGSGGRPSPPGRAEQRGAAAGAAVASELAAVKDALEELEQALSGGGGGEAAGAAAEWSEAERRLSGPCVGLVKAARACLKKLLAALEARGRRGDAPERALAGEAAQVSPSVDELVLSTYPPVNPLTLRLNAGKLASVLKKILEVARASHVCAASEENWMQFLAGAIDHNMDKIKGFTQGVL